jgi:hypothetical protein
VHKLTSPHANASRRGADNAIKANCAAIRINEESRPPAPCPGRNLISVTPWLAP